MDVRRLLATVYAYLVDRYDAKIIDEWLAEPFESELTDEERRRLEYRRRARELGIDTTGGTQSLIDAFRTPTAGRASA